VQLFTHQLHPMLLLIFPYRYYYADGGASRLPLDAGDGCSVHAHRPWDTRFKMAIRLAGVSDVFFS
jgi:hypothetical protein